MMYARTFLTWSSAELSHPSVSASWVFLYPKKAKNKTCQMCLKSLTLRICVYVEFSRCVAPACWSGGPDWTGSVGETLSQLGAASAKPPPPSSSQTTVTTPAAAACRGRRSRRRRRGRICGWFPVRGGLEQIWAWGGGQRGGWGNRWRRNQRPQHDNNEQGWS